MDILKVALLVLFAISAILLILVVLVQDEQSEGLGGLFGGSSNSQIGNRKGNILTKTTTVLGTIFLISAFSLALVNREKISEPLPVVETKTSADDSAKNEWWAEKAPDASTSTETVEPVEANSDTTSDLEMPETTSEAN